MARPRKIIRPLEKTISLPETLCAQVDLLFYSSVEGRVPHGSWSRYVEALIGKDLAAREVGKELAHDSACL